jgi:CRISPR/Cas system-associated endonuclease Cas3-HD
MAKRKSTKKVAENQEVKPTVELNDPVVEEIKDKVDLSDTAVAVEDIKDKVKIEEKKEIKQPEIKKIKEIKKMSNITSSDLDIHFLVGERKVKKDTDDNFRTYAISQLF